MCDIESTSRTTPSRNRASSIISARSRIRASGVRRSCATPASITARSLSACDTCSTIWLKPCVSWRSSRGRAHAAAAPAGRGRSARPRVPANAAAAAVASREQRGDHAGREDRAEPQQHPVERARRPQRLNRHHDPVAVGRLLHPQHRRMSGRADLDLRAGRHAVAHVVAEPLQRRRQPRITALRHVGAVRRHEPHARRQRLVGRARDVLAHRVDEERGSSTA